MESHYDSPCWYTSCAGLTKSPFLDPGQPLSSGCASRWHSTSRAWQRFSSHGKRDYSRPKRPFGPVHQAPAFGTGGADLRDQVPLPIFIRASILWGAAVSFSSLLTESPRRPWSVLDGSVAAVWPTPTCARRGQARDAEPQTCPSGEATVVSAPIGAAPSPVQPVRHAEQLSPMWSSARIFRQR